jgi:hypothetical protein
MAMATEFNAGSFMGRWLFAILLVFGTYNPSDYSYVSWLLGENVEFGPILAIVGLLLLIGWIIYLRATFMALGVIGITLGAALFAAVMWLLVDIGLISLEATGVITYIVLLILSFILATGMSWSHIRRRLTGQFDVDDMDD